MSKSTIVRIDSNTKKKLEDLAQESGDTMVEILKKAIEEYRQKEFLRKTNEAYAELRKDEKISKELDEETASWDSTLMDGLDPDEIWEERPPHKKRKTREKK